MPEFVQAADGFIDYAPDNVNTVSQEEMQASHEVMFNPYPDQSQLDQQQQE